jgi:hypothetical protein
MRLNPHPEMMPVIPKVRPLKWWLWRLATVAVVVSFFAALMVPWPKVCQFDLGPSPRIKPSDVARLLHELGCDPPNYQIALRIEVALTGVLVALLLVGLGNFLDRRHSGRASLRY